MKLNFPDIPIWVNSRTEGLNVAWIWDRALVMIKLSATERDAVLQKRSAEELFEFLNGRMAQQVLFDSLHAVESNEKKLEVRFVSKRGAIATAVSRNALSRCALEMETAEDRSQLFAELRTRLEPAKQYSRCEYSRFRAALPGLGGLALTALITTGMYFGAASAADPEFEPTSPKARLVWPVLRKVLQTLGPYGVVAIGAVCALVLLVRLAQNVADPPIMLRIK